MQITNPEPIKKWCRYCRKVKPVEEFDKKSRGKYKGTLRSICSSCYEASDQNNEKENGKRSGNKRREETILYPEIQKYLSAKFRAQEKDLPFDIEVSDIVIPETCPVLGIPIFRSFVKGGAGPNSPSLDRIIPELGYVKGNVTVISQRANMMKQNASLEQCVLLGKYAERMIIARDFLSKNKEN